MLLVGGWEVVVGGCDVVDERDRRRTGRATDGAGEGSSNEASKQAVVPTESGLRHVQRRA